MNQQPRKKSPRAPSIALDEALDRVLKAYDKDRLHPAPTDVVAQHIGYKGANSGAALQALASLRYYGLLDRPREGVLAVTKEVEAYKFAPNDEMRYSLLQGFLRRPPLFAELLDKYGSKLPSDANLKFDLIQRGFIPVTANALVGVLRRSVEYVGSSPTIDPAVLSGDSLAEDEVPAEVEGQSAYARSSMPVALAHDESVGNPDRPASQTHDQIPVRLPGGRRAWLTIPTPFYDSDKQRLKAQIDLLLTEDDELSG